MIDSCQLKLGRPYIIASCNANFVGIYRNIGNSGTISFAPALSSPPPPYLSPMNLKFLGAAATVTGSMHLITTSGGSRVLLDCGLYQGPRQQAQEINSRLPFDPASLTAVVLSHAHIDHS